MFGAICVETHPNLFLVILFLRQHGQCVHLKVPALHRLMVGLKIPAKDGAQHKILQTL